MSFDTEFDFDYSNDWCHNCKLDGNNIMHSSEGIVYKCFDCQFYIKTSDKKKDNEIEIQDKT